MNHRERAEYWMKIVDDQEDATVNDDMPVADAVAMAQVYATLEQNDLLERIADALGPPWTDAPRPPQPFEWQGPRKP